jgi:hypothetical protein
VFWCFGQSTKTVTFTDFSDVFHLIYATILWDLVHPSLEEKVMQPTNIAARAANQWQPNLGVVASWASWDKLKVGGHTALEAIKDGGVGKLRTKTGQYVILEERDFQKLYGLAQEIHRLRNGLRVVTTAVRAVQRHGDKETIETLIEAVGMLGTMPTLPSRDGHLPIKPEGLELDPEEGEYELDPQAINSPLEKR